MFERKHREHIVVPLSPRKWPRPGFSENGHSDQWSVTTAVVVVVDFGSWVLPPFLNCLLTSCHSTFLVGSALGRVIPAKNRLECEFDLKE